MDCNVIAFPKIYVPPPQENLSFPDAPPQQGAFQTTIVDRTRHPFSWERPMRLLISILPEVERQSEDVVQPDRLACHNALARLAVDFAQCCFGPRSRLLPMIATLEASEGGLFYTILLDVPYHASLLELERLTYQAFGEMLDDCDSEEGIPGVVISEVAGAGELLHFMGRVVVPSATDNDTN